MIKNVTVFKNNKGGVKVRVNYGNEKEITRVRTFTEKDNQPKSVVLFKLNSKNVETKCTETGTVTTFR